MDNFSFIIHLIGGRGEENRAIVQRVREPAMLGPYSRTMPRAPWKPPRTPEQDRLLGPYSRTMPRALWKPQEGDLVGGRSEENRAVVQRVGEPWLEGQRGVGVRER